MKRNEFINFIGPLIVKECRERGYKFPSAIIAQACLESNYGRSSLSLKYFNYFGMKCGSSWKGTSVNFETMEEYNPGTLTKIRDNFRAYDTPEAGIKGYFDFISSKRYHNLKESRTPLEYIERLKSDGWATSSSYVKSVYNTLISNSLEKYDSVQKIDADNISVQEKDITVIAQEVISGKWGNGKERREKLNKAGYNYNSVQEKVNSILGVKK